MDRIHVSVRARPLSSDDAKSSPWRISGNSIFIPNQPTEFEFDQIFGEDCKTQDVYLARTRDIVAAALRGCNGTVFAYGQTSTGKTHTMRGSSSEPGVIPLAVHELFDNLQQDMDREFLLRMSYMEIYNEDVNDLLAPEHRKLQVHESNERGIFVAGLREEIVASSDQVLELMEYGESHRHIGETNMNVYSSRSHTIFRMIIESREKSEEVEAELSCDAVRVSVLNLVDLAGSERAAKTGAEGVRLKEGSHINKSLMTLGTVIKKLSEGAKSQGGHVPYRDSKLTRILQPALGGNANTAIICNITLAQIHLDETKSSLQFASRALRVTNCAKVNEIVTDAALVKRQKKEIEELRDKLQGLHSEHLEDDVLNLRNTLLKSELERERMALELEKEKRAQAEREKRLQEQAKEIEYLSSMVFSANREDSGDVYKKIDILEMEKSSSQQQLDSVVDLATEQTVFAKEECEKLYEELVLAREKATVAHDTLSSATFSTGEKACSERELKKLQNQKAILERDMSKRESVIDRSSGVFDHKRSKGSNSFADLEEYKKLTAANEERDVATSRAESLAFDFQSLSDELSLSNSELCELKEELSSLRTSLEESRSHALETENFIKILLEEKEELSMQFNEVLLAMELELSGLRKERQNLLAQVQELEGRQQQQQPVSPDRQYLLAQVQELEGRQQQQQPVSPDDSRKDSFPEEMETSYEYEVGNLSSEEKESQDSEYVPSVQKKGRPKKKKQPAPAGVLICACSYRSTCQTIACPCYEKPQPCSDSCYCTFKKCKNKAE